MGRKIVIFIVILLAVHTVSFGQAELNSKQIGLENNDALIYTLLEDQLKINASDIDLLTIKVQSESNEILPELYMPTSHNNLYLLVDFTNCLSGTYLITGSKGQDKISFTIIFKKD